MQNVPKRIRRCLNCGNKTHHTLWKNEACPICGSGEGYLESTHGGLASKQIEEQRKFISTIQKLRSCSRIQEESNI